MTDWVLNVLTWANHTQPLSLSFTPIPRTKKAYLKNYQSLLSLYSSLLYNIPRDKNFLLNLLLKTKIKRILWTNQAAKMMMKSSAKRNEVDRKVSQVLRVSIFVGQTLVGKNLVFFIRWKAFNFISVSPNCHPEGFGNLCQKKHATHFSQVKFQLTSCQTLNWLRPKILYLALQPSCNIYQKPLNILSQDFHC